MRKYVVTVVVLAFLLFALGLTAQTMGSGQTSMPSGTNSSQNPNSPAGEQTNPPMSEHPSTTGTWGQGSTTSQSGASTTSDTPKDSHSGMQGKAESSSMGHEHMGKAKTLEGCVVREETDYYLIPKHGNPVRLSAGSNDLSAHVGHRVKIRGNEMPASGNVAETSHPRSEPSEAQNPSGTGSAAGMSGAATGTTGSSQESQSKSGSISGKAGTSGSTTGTTTSNDMRSAAKNEMMVERIDMVSESCPSNWNSRWSNTATSSSTTEKNPSNK